MGNAGKKVKVHYVGTLDDGTEFDSSIKRGEPIEFVCMAGMMIPGFDKAVEDMGTEVYSHCVIASPHPDIEKIIERYTLDKLLPY